MTPVLARPRSTSEDALAKDVFEYRRGFARLLDMPFGRQEDHRAIASAAALYKKLVTSTEGYVGRYPPGGGAQGGYRRDDSAFAEDRDANFWGEWPDDPSLPVSGALGVAA